MKKILYSPITLLVSIVLGVIAGIFFPKLNVFLGPVNSMYTSLLQVCTLPVIIAFLTLSIREIFQKKFRRIIWKVLLFSLIAVILATILGMVSSIAMKDFLTPSDSDKIELIDTSNMVNNKDISDSFLERTVYEKNKITNQRDYTFKDFIVSIIPTNIFTSLAENRVLQVVIFFVAFGFALIFVDKSFSQPIIDLFEGISEALFKFINLLCLFLPFSIFITVLSLFASENTMIVFDSIWNFIVVIYIALGILILVSAIIIIKRTKAPIRQHLSAMKRIFFLSLGTGTTFIVLPAAIDDAVHKHGMDETTMKSFLPIGTIFASYGNVVTAAITSMFALLLYDHELDSRVILVIIFSSVLFAIVYMAGLPLATILPIALQPFDLPSDIMLMVLVSAIPFYSGLLAFADMYSMLAVTSLITPRDELRQNMQDIINKSQNDVLKFRSH